MVFCSSSSLKLCPLALLRYNNSFNFIWRTPLVLLPDLTILLKTSSPALLRVFYLIFNVFCLFPRVFSVYSCCLHGSEECSFEHVWVSTNLLWFNGVCVGLHSKCRCWKEQYLGFKQNKVWNLENTDYFTKIGAIFPKNSSILSKNHQFFLKIIIFFWK